VIEVLAQTPPTGAQTWIPAAFSAVAAIVAGWLVYRNGRSANRVNEQDTLSKQQLAWTQQAMFEATAAKTEARAATEQAGEAERSAKAASAAADSATRRAASAEGRLSEVQELTGRLLDWIARVVRKAHEVEAGEVTDPHVRELIRAINGGPPEISSSEIRRRAQ
jgi:hypothetical protein